MARSKGWKFEPARHALAAKGIKTYAYAGTKIRNVTRWYHRMFGRIDLSYHNGKYWVEVQHVPNFAESPDFPDEFPVAREFKTKEEALEEVERWMRF